MSENRHIIAVVTQALCTLKNGGAISVDGALVKALEFAEEASGELLISAERAELLGLGTNAVIVQAGNARSAAGLAEYDGEVEVIGQANAHYEAALSLAVLGEILPALLVCDDEADAEVSVAQIAAYPQALVETLEPAVRSKLVLKHAKDVEMVLFRSAGAAMEHYALVVGDISGVNAPLTRVHSSCVTGDLFESMLCDCGDQLRGALSQMEAEGAGVLLYMVQEGRGIGLANKLRAYGLKAQGMDTVDANRALGFGDDLRPYDAAAKMLKALGVGAVRLLSNNPRKAAGLQEAGITVAESVPLKAEVHEHNAHYLDTKVKRLGHTG